MATNPNVSMVSGGILTLTSWLLAVRLPDRGCSQVLLVWSFSGILARRPAVAKKVASVRLAFAHLNLKLTRLSWSTD